MRHGLPYSLSALAVIGVSLAVGGCERFMPGGDSSAAVELSGTVEARQTDLAFRIRGRMLELRRDEGDRVTRGDVVATLEAEDQEIALRRARAEADAAAARLAELEAGTRAQEIRAGEAMLARSRAERVFAVSEVQRLEPLVPRELASQEALDRARMRLDVARAGVNEARERLELLREGPRKEQIERARAELDARRAAVAAAQRRLTYTRLESPVSGMVEVRLAEAGEVVGAAQPVLRVAELDEPWVRAYLSETDLARVRLGQSAEVRVDGLPDQVFDGTLSFIASEAEFTPKTVETRELRVDLVYRVKIRVDDPQGRLKIGMPADVTLQPQASASPAP